MIEMERIFPKQVQIFVSEVCQESCRYCPYTLMSPKERKELLAKELTIKQWQRAVEYLSKKMGIRLFAFIGGEPAAKKGIEKLLAFMKRRLPGVEMLFITSGISLLRNKILKEKIIKAGVRNFIVSVDGIRKKSRLKPGSSRKSALGLRFLLELRKEYPKLIFKLGANCILNKNTLDLIIPTYRYLADQQIYLNLCPEQTLCFERESKTSLDKKDRPLLKEVTKRLVKIKRQPGNFLINSEDYLRRLPALCFERPYKCSERLSPTTIHIMSDGEVPFCSWRKGETKGRFDIMEIVNGQKKFSHWLSAWKEDKNGKQCSCSWSFSDRVGDFNKIPLAPHSNIWYHSC